MKVKFNAKTRVKKVLSLQSLQSAESELWIDRTAANDIKVAKHSCPAASNTVKEQLQVVTVLKNVKHQLT